MKTSQKNSGIIFTIAIFFFGFFFMACQKENVTSPVENSNVESIENQYIVVLDSPQADQLLGNTTMTQYAKTILTEYNIPAENMKIVYEKVVKGFMATLSPEAVQKLQMDKRIQYIEKDQVFSLNDVVEYTNPKDNNILVQTTPWGITAVGGSVNASTSTGVAWIVDTGIDLDHPDLNVNTTLSRTFVTTSPDNASADDNHGHGSHVSGIIAAKNNTVGSIGVCAGATLIAVKVMNYRGSGTISSIVNGLDYISRNLVSNRINVVNMSIGGSASTTLDNAVRSLAGYGAYVCVAAGNSAANSEYYSPARVNATRVFTISAFGSNGAFASFSNYGTPIDFSAPGVSIYSTYRGGGYATMSGTSMATPYACGILLADNGTINWNGYVTNDRDSDPDEKAIR
jgi:subtilisin family serine protease